MLAGELFASECLSRLINQGYSNQLHAHRISESIEVHRYTDDWNIIDDISMSLTGKDSSLIAACYSGLHLLKRMECGHGC